MQRTITPARRSSEQQRAPFALIPSELLRNPELTPTERLVWALIDDHEGERPFVRVKAETLALELGCNERTVRRAIETLATRGLLQVLATGRSSAYRTKNPARPNRPEWTRKPRKAASTEHPFDTSTEGVVGVLECPNSSDTHVRSDRTPMSALQSNKSGGTSTQATASPPNAPSAPQARDGSSASDAQLVQHRDEAKGEALGVERDSQSHAAAAAATRSLSLEQLEALSVLQGEGVTTSTAAASSPRAFGDHVLKLIPMTLEHTKRLERLFERAIRDRWDAQSLAKVWTEYPRSPKAGSGVWVLDLERVLNECVPPAATAAPAIETRGALLTAKLSKVLDGWEVRLNEYDEDGVPEVEASVWPREGHEDAWVFDLSPSEAGAWFARFTCEKFSDSDYSTALEFVMRRAMPTHLQWLEFSRFERWGSACVELQLPSELSERDLVPLLDELAPALQAGLEWLGDLNGEDEGRQARAWSPVLEAVSARVTG